MSNSKILLLLALFYCAIDANAQQGRGTILGTVTDSSGAAIAGARVSIVNVDTNNITNAETNNDGFYTSPALNVGNYQVTAEHAGFKKAVRSGIILEIDQHAEINIRLDVGAVSESVEVTGSAPLVNTENGSIGQVVENRNVEELPLNGRNAFALILLAPDVHSNAGPIQSGFADRGTSLSDWSINGSPNSVNNMLVDGMVASNSYYPDLYAELAVDAAQEFKVQSGSMSAEYGFTLGGVINVATKAGTNNFHGTAYEFVRNNVFDSRKAFAAAELPFRYNQYGLALGGPVILPSSTTAEIRPSSSATGNSTTTSITARASHRYLAPPGAMAISRTYIQPPALSFPSTIPTLLSSIPTVAATSARNSSATLFQHPVSIRSRRRSILFTRPRT